MTRSIYPTPTVSLTLDGLPMGAGFVDATTADGPALKGIVVQPREGMRGTPSEPGLERDADKFDAVARSEAKGGAIVARGT